jgi:hypothetical protein
MSSFCVLVPGAAMLCVAHKCLPIDSRKSEQSDETGSHDSRLRLAFRRYIQARDTEQDRQLLSSYLTKLEDEVNSNYHVFISCAYLRIPCVVSFLLP